VDCRERRSGATDHTACRISLINACEPRVRYGWRTLAGPENVRVRYRSKSGPGFRLVPVIVDVPHDAHNLPPGLGFPNLFYPSASDGLCQYSRARVSDTIAKGRLFNTSVPVKSRAGYCGIPWSEKAWRNPNQTCELAGADPEHVILYLHGTALAPASMGTAELKSAEDDARNRFDIVENTPRCPHTEDRSQLRAKPV